ncbi:Ditrans,polycis-polyprenyl diphosphate synthase ((2E,6E)-farnesyldiphosphate specific) [Aphelenchoides bicaudatus]|nr:Ditrans,polycis-polyprenyl diphosphate synthase ((2E,6E)-farnesyldiphosphate specific) [Aphelenchoides bicaudatus]
MKFTHIDMALLPNGTMQDGNLAQAMLTAVFLNLVYIFVILVDAVSFICSKRSINCVKNLLQSVRKKAFIEPLKIPNHLAIAFGVDDLISVTLLCDFILYSAQNGVHQLTFYDTEGRIESLFEDLEFVFGRLSKRKLLRQRVNFNKLASSTTTATSFDLQVCALSKRHGKQLLTEICAELSQQPEPITSGVVRERLQTSNIHEVDFLVTIGCSNTTSDYPPWALRLAEIYHIDQLDSGKESLREREFNTMLSSFSNRDRRMGY